MTRELSSQSQDQGDAAGLMTEDTGEKIVKAIVSGGDGGDGASSLAAGAVNHAKDSAKNALKNSHFFHGLQTDFKILISLVQAICRLLSSAL